MMTEPTDDTAREPSRKISMPVILIGIRVFLGITATAAWSIELPYLAFGPGPVSDAADSVVVDGVAVYPPEGELLMLTIVSQDVNLFEAAIAGLDPTIDLVPKEAVRRTGESDEEYRNRVLQQMDDSNFRSVAVALEYLGIDLVSTEVVINEFVEGVPAAEVLALGDTIVAVNGSEIGTAEEIRPLIEGVGVGESIVVLVDRNGEQFEVEVFLAEREDEPGVPMIGVILGELSEPPFPIEIEAGDVGGPSAGMMHTLAIIDTLTEGELTAGYVIAGTGTIRMDGTVGSIGGIRQKVPAAEAAGATHILVPEGNYESALTADYDHIEIVPIATIDDAVTFLESLEAA